MNAEALPTPGDVQPVGPTGWAGVHNALPLVVSLPESAAARLLILGVAAGLLGQLLFVLQLPGINYPLWVALVLACAYLLHRPGAVLARNDVWLPVAAVGFAAFVGLRDEAPLLLFDVLASGGLALLALVAIGGRPVTGAGWASFLENGIVAGVTIVIGAVFAAPGLRRLNALTGGSSGTRRLAVVRGLLLALPLLVIFVVLFAAADAVFSAQLGSIVVLPNGAELAVRLTFAAITGWLFVGALCVAWLPPRASGEVTVPTVGLQLGIVEAVVTLAALDVLFAIFVALQAAYLFGGLDTLAVSGMTYADYARRGFFELLMVALLAAAVILAMRHFIERRTRSFVLLAGLLVVLTGVVLISAAYRMALYQGAYGWTELRFYVFVLIGWLAIGLLTLLAALIADRPAIVVRVAIGAGLLIAIGCNLFSPQAFVTQQNLARAIDPRLVAPGGETGLDVSYLSGLGADSIPTLINARSSLHQPQRADVDAVLQLRATRLLDLNAALGWPSFNLARQQALDHLTAAGY
jgi:hypothetical protein